MSGSDEGKAHELVIIRRRSGGEEGGHHGGVWKIAYADFMTAMMAFFLVMWLINSTDKKTLTQVATYFNPMRLTDKRPTPKGLEEPDGSEGKESTSQKGAKKKDGDSRGKQKKEEVEPGEVRSRGRPFQREMEEQDQKASSESGATAGESPRQAGGRAYRDPFDSAHRSEIIPTEPSTSKAARTTLSATAPPGSSPPVTAPVAPLGAGAPIEASPAPLGTASPITAPPAPKGADVAIAAPSVPPPTALPVPAPEAGPQPSMSAPAPAPSATEAVRDTKAESKHPSEPELSKDAVARADAEQLKVALKKSIAESLPGILPNIDVTVTADGVLISLTDDYEFGMFAIGSAEPRPATIVVMDKVAKILLPRTEPLIVRGHTDRRPYRNGGYDNWRLSAARAHMAYVMLTRGGVDEKRFERIEGYADRSLRIPEEPEAAQNRRIEILLRKQIQ